MTDDAENLQHASKVICAATRTIKAIDLLIDCYEELAIVMPDTEKEHMDMARTMVKAQEVLGELVKSNNVYLKEVDAIIAQQMGGE